MPAPEPKPDAHTDATREPIERGIVVLDASLRVLLHGSSPATIVPAERCVLERMLADETAGLPAYDFERFRVATGFAADDRCWRALRIGVSHASYLVLVECSTLPAAVRQFASDRGLGEFDAAVLRMIVGGYSLEESAERLDLSILEAARKRLELLSDIGEKSTADLVRRIAAEDRAATLGRLDAAMEATLERIGVKR